MFYSRKIKDSKIQIDGQILRVEKIDEGCTKVLVKGFMRLNSQSIPYIHLLAIGSDIPLYFDDGNTRGIVGWAQVMTPAEIVAENKKGQAKRTNTEASSSTYAFDWEIDQVLHIVKDEDTREVLAAMRQAGQVVPVEWLPSLCDAIDEWLPAVATLRTCGESRKERIVSLRRMITASAESAHYATTI